MGKGGIFTQMRKIWVLIAAISIITPHDVVGDDLNVNDTKIKDLEKQRDDLLIEINDAIDDTLLSLNATNDTDSLLTLNHMTELKKQLKQLNETQEPEDPPDEIYEGSLPEELQKEHNASIDRRYASIVSSRNKKIKLDLAEIVKLLNRSEKGKAHKKIEENEIMEKKIALWLWEREREKKRIEEYRIKQLSRFPYYKQEKCPNFGIDKTRKKGSSWRRSSGKRKKMKKRKGKPVYPCCRKCCKQSYMGCL